MSKNFLLPVVALALAASSCTKHDVIGHNQSGFVDPTLVNFSAYAGKSRAASTTAETFKEFQVYGYRGELGADASIVWDSEKPTLLMDNVKVSKTSDVWETLSPTPWPAEGTHVQFFAFSPAASDASG
ncbi:MAG: fimbrillin family protein, partial [Phocaeicola sp.]